MNLLQCYLINNDCYKAGRKIKPKGIVVHSTGANNKTLKRYIQPAVRQTKYIGNKTRQEVVKLLGVNSYNNHWNRPGLNRCVNAFIGALASGAVATVQTLPWDARPWGCGAGAKGSYNNSHIQFEICEDGLRDSTYFTEVYREATQLCSYLCSQYGLSVDSIVSHSEAHRAGYGSNHADPEHWFKLHGKSMDDFRADVAKILHGSSYMVRIAAAQLNVRSGPGVSYTVTCTVRAKEVYTIVDTRGVWGKLKSGAGWINLNYTTRL